MPMKRIWKNTWDKKKDKKVAKKPRYYTGLFKPKNFKKYKGDPTNIVYRSRWELLYMMHLDRSEHIVEWQSEELCIPYVSPKDNRVHRYFIDFLVKRRNKEGIVETYLVEIKPKAQTAPPTQPTDGRKKKRYLAEVVQYGVNQAKWSAARAYCEHHGYKFQIVTEKELKLK